MTTNLPTTPADDGDTTASGMFVNALRDDEGRVVIGLDPTAAGALYDLLEAVDLLEYSQNPSYMGCSKEDGEAISEVGFAIMGKLQKLLG